MKSNPLQELLSHLGVSFPGDKLIGKYANEKSPLRSELFSGEQMEQYARKLAGEHTLLTGRRPEQLLKRLAENESLLLEVHQLLTTSARENNRIAPAGEWLLDNFYLIEEHIYTGKKHLPKGYSEGLPRLQKGPSKGLPRVYDIALEIISHSDGRVDLKTLQGFVAAYMTVSQLEIGELWAIPIMLRIALIENLRRLATQLAVDMINKNLADYWADQMTETAEKDPQNLIIVIANMAKSRPPMVSSFVAELTRRLLGKGPALTLPLTWIEQRLAENGLTSNGLVHLENQKQAADQVSMSNSIGSLRFLNNTDWREFIETTSLVEKVLREDPAGIYPVMDFQTRDHYRHVVEKIAKHSNLSEEEVARIAILLAKETPVVTEADERKKHVGYYLTGTGLYESEKKAKMIIPGRVKFKRSFARFPLLLYGGVIILFTLILAGILFTKAYTDGSSTGWLITMGFLLVIGTSQLIITLINWLSTLLVNPEFLPKMDYSGGITKSSRSLVVVPCILTSSLELESLLETIEVHFLANRDENLHFALLSDFADAAAEILPDENVLLQTARQKIEELNKKYNPEKNDSFFLFHRPRKWNPVDKIWMGYERKRGKLSELNALLRGRARENFMLIVGDEEIFPTIKYVITLDRDTQLPRDAARKIVATLAHPLNRAFYNEKKERVTEGYTILQPRVATSLPRTNSSLFTRMHGNEPGIDPYTCAISDVYQDLFREGSFIGKGIYEVDMFEKVLENRFPENRILSHDLLEGCYARSGLLSDVQLFEDYPAGYIADMQRRHRWIRGDWQIGRWLFAQVPGADKHTKKNPLSKLSRWKIADNLRRSLVAPALTLILLFGWMLSPSPWFWTFSTLGLILLSPVIVFIGDICKKPDDVLLSHHAVHSTLSAINGLIQRLFILTCLPYEAFVNIDAIIRTNWRMFITHKKLLEWNPYQNGGSTSKSIFATYRSMWIGPFLAVAIFIFLLVRSPLTLEPSLSILILWMVSPAIAWWISLPAKKRETGISMTQKIFLLKLARKTWSFFENFTGPKDNWLPPDNYQEVPVERIAHRTSPTNIGLSLLSNLAAWDFGYLSTGQLIERTTNTFSTLQQLERYHGHFFNWYDTRSLLTLAPRYISTVDSGNLTGLMLVLKQGLLSIKNQKISGCRLFEGIRDTFNVLSEKMVETELLTQLKKEVNSACETGVIDLETARLYFEKMTEYAGKIFSTLPANPDSESFWWARSLTEQIDNAYDDLLALAPWLSLPPAPAAFIELAKSVLEIPTLLEMSRIETELLPKIKDCYREENTAVENEWLGSYQKYLTEAGQRARERILVIERLAQQCVVFSSIEYEFLYDRSKNLLSIGYNTEEQRKDPGFYDLLGSESRLAVFIGIAQGKLPQASWFALGRQLTTPGSSPVLLSWSGSMFEYLMPMIIMPTYENTLLDQTNKTSVQRQIEYGKKHALPWGISESAYNMVDAQLNYQYRAFGVPGLGLKRGLGQDLVIAPYASIMALMVLPREACENLELLTSKGFEGRYGYYEAVDYTPARLPRGKSNVLVRSFMSHHEGMSLLSLAYYLLDQPMQKRFESEAQFQATLLLLQEKIPKVTTFYTPTVDLADISSNPDDLQTRIITTADTPVPEIQLLSNGRYHVMVTNSGGGYSRWNDFAVTRWREDSTCDNWGSFCFIRDLENNLLWSSGHQPSLREADNYEVIFSQGRAEFRRRDNSIETHTTIVVSPEDDVEMRRVHITNRSRKRRYIEITSYAEVVLASPMSDAIHPAFSNLFVQTEIISQRHAILCTRRPRSLEEKPPFMFHLMNVQDADIREITYETSRDKFIGRGNIISDPQAMREPGTLSGTQGSVLDPIVSIQYRIMLNPQESATIDMVFGIGETREVCNGLIEKYQERHLIDRAFELAWTHSQVVLRQINATEADAQLYARLASSVIFANASLRGDPGILTRNNRGQSGLWSYSVSGDLPIILLQIEDSANIELVKQLVQAHAYWRLKGLVADLVIWNEDHGGYRQTLQNNILAIIAPGIVADMQDRPGGIYIRSADQISNEDRILFQAVARVIISDKLGSLDSQINQRNRLKNTVPDFSPSRFSPSVETPVSLPGDLQFFNGIGGFSKDGNEYVIITTPGLVTPAPWVNVLANPDFGTVISESGQSYTWIENAHEFRLTPWNNDPVTDAAGECFYLRDEENGHYWSPMSLPARGRSPYITRHGFGYSVFEHGENGISSETWVYVDPVAPVKYTHIKLKNNSGRNRRLSATGYVEWVLGDLKSKYAMHIVTELDINSGAILARNSYNTELGQRVAFFDVDEVVKTITTDRTEFIGRNGTLKNPEAMFKTKLSGKIGAALDPCAAIQVTFDLAEGEEREIIFRIGAGKDPVEASKTIRQSRGNKVASEALNKVKAYWQKTLTAIQVTTPDPSLNMLANGWLNYQTLACRLWARSGFYQSGGAFGFRDQLQDVLSILHSEPKLARNQILLCASRQFIEGDVQHWWHPPVGRGVRTRCSDDYLWLPFVAARYAMVTGDLAVWEEPINFLEGRQLNSGEESYYDLALQSGQSASLYDHCLKAIEHGLQFGEHGLPLIGSGDWNDGMDKVGEHGKGESIWLGFFLFNILRHFAKIAHLRNDLAIAERYEAKAEELTKNIGLHAWDGEWYRRAYFDDGSPLGSSANPECKIDSIVQSWSVLSACGDPDRSRRALEAADKRLVREKDSLIQLFDPPFDKSAMNPGYIKGYVPGVRENGGQYTHAAIWMIMAFAALGNKKRVWELLKMINPVHHAGTPKQISIYKVEPYVIAADVYAVSQHTGRGGWTWYTGSAGWMYQLIVESLLGINRQGTSLRFTPCIPAEWGSVYIRYRYLETVYSITFLQDHTSSEKMSLSVDNLVQENKAIDLVNDHNEHIVIVNLPITMPVPKNAVPI